LCSRWCPAKNQTLRSIEILSAKLVGVSTVALEYSDGGSGRFSTRFLKGSDAQLAYVEPIASDQQDSFAEETPHAPDDANIF
jgi:hypothetical protein